LHKYCESPKFAPHGKGREGILIVLESPSNADDENGSYYSGKSGAVVRDTMLRLGYDIDKDCKSIYAVGCKLAGNIIKDESARALCEPGVWNVIAEMKPRTIIAMGQLALKTVMRHTSNVGDVVKWAGSVISDRDLKAAVCPTQSPVEVIMDRTGITRKYFIEDLERVSRIHKRKKKMVFHTPNHEEQYVTRLVDSKKVMRFLKDVARNYRHKDIAIDYETSGLKPHRKEHAILCASIAFGPKSAVSFILREEHMPIFKRILYDKTIGKIAHNMKFEMSWSREKVGTMGRGWLFDTMVAQHVVDNRTGVAGLKYQTYIRYGVRNYDSHISSFLKSEEESANGFNNVKDAPPDQVLMYCGLDTIYTYMLAFDLVKELKHKTIKFRSSVWQPR